MPSHWSLRREVSAESSRLLIERAHEEFVGGNAQDPRVAAVRGLVRESWHRSARNLVGVEAVPPLDLVSAELDEYRRTHPLASVMDMIRQLLLPGDDDESGVVVAVGDAAGRLLWVEGDRRIRDLTADMGFVAGANWSEGAVGTSAPGTALALESSVQIRGAEHFNRLVQPWSCTAAPVRDPESRRVLGVIDVTGGAEATTPQAQLLVDATARAIEGELLVARLRARAESGPDRRSPRRTRGSSEHATLRVLGRDLAVLDVVDERGATVIELSARHAEILLMLAAHQHGLSAERLAALVYGETAPVETLRPEMVRLRRVLDAVAPALIPASRPYRLTSPLQTDADHVVSLLDRGAHRVALTAYRGSVLPDSRAPGVEELRQSVQAALRESLLAGAGLDVLLAYIDTDEGREDADALRLCLEMLAPRSPRRGPIVARLEQLEG